jgi:response regulator RpfG family c-di-GMP phosphodiesterase
MEALEVAKEKCPDVPFIFVTGTLGEELAIETLKKGATDYVLKHRLPRLVPSVHRALREAKERVERKRAEAQLRESHDQLRALSVYLQYVREEERTTIAREVHDELGQALSGLKLQLVWLTNHFGANSGNRPGAGGHPAPAGRQRRSQSARAARLVADSLGQVPQGRIQATGPWHGGP